MYITGYDGTGRALNGSWPEFTSGYVYHIDVEVDYHPSRPSELVDFTDLTEYKFTVEFPSVTYNSVDHASRFEVFTANSLRVLLDGADTALLTAGRVNISYEVGLGAGNAYLIGYYTLKSAVAEVSTTPPQETLLPQVYENLAVRVGTAHLLQRVTMPWGAVDISAEEAPWASGEIRIDGGPATPVSFIQDGTGNVQAALPPFTVPGTYRYSVGLSGTYLHSLVTSSVPAANVSHMPIWQGRVTVLPRDPAFLVVPLWSPN